MKRVMMFFAAALLLPAMMVACAKSSENKSASTPLNGAVYNNYAQFGFSAYPTNGYATNGSYYGGYSYQAYNPYTSNGACSACGAASIPVYNGAFGLGCLQTAQVTSVQYMIGWVYPTVGANGQVTSIPQYSNIPSTGTCQAAQSCTMDGTGACQAGYRCAAATGSNMGVCLSNNQSYNPYSYGY